MNVSTVRTRDWSLSGQLDGRLAGETLFCSEFKFELAGHTVPLLALMSRNALSPNVLSGPGHNPNEMMSKEVECHDIE